MLSCRFKPFFHSPYPVNGCPPTKRVSPYAFLELSNNDASHLVMVVEMSVLVLPLRFPHPSVCLSVVVYCCVIILCKTKPRCRPQILSFIIHLHRYFTIVVINIYKYI